MSLSTAGSPDALIFGPELVMHAFFSVLAIQFWGFFFCSFVGLHFSHYWLDPQVLPNK